MYGHAYPSSSMQQQQQQQQQRQPQVGQDQSPTMAVGGMQGVNYANMMSMGGMSMDGQQQQQSYDGTGINPALMFNPQLQALLQQQMAQQQAIQPPSQVGGQQQQQQQQQQIRWPNSAANGQSFPQQSQQGESSQTGQIQSIQPSYGQPFNPFVQQQQQQLQQQQLMQQQNNLGQSMGSQPSLDNFAAAYLAQAQAQQQQQKFAGGQGNSIQGVGSVNPTAFLGMNNEMGGNNGIIDSSALMQANSFAAMSSAANGTLPLHMQIASAPSHQQMQNHSPKTSSNASTIATPEPKPKGRPKGSTKKKKEEAARLQQQQQQQQLLQQQQQQQQRHHHQQMLLQQQQQQQQQQHPHAVQGLPFAHSTIPSPAPSYQQTPTPSHASIPPTHTAASPAVPPHILAQQQDRARSNTKSPSVANSFAHAGPSALISSSNSMPLSRAIPPGWTPSLSAVQQQQLLGQALSFSKAQSARATNGHQQTPSPAHILMQLGYVYVKAAVLPNNGQGAGIPGNGTSGAGAVLSIDEARMIGLLPQPVSQEQRPGQAQAQAQGQIQQQANMGMASYPPPSLSEADKTPQSTQQVQPMPPPATIQAIPGGSAAAYRPVATNASLPLSSPIIHSLSSPAKKQTSNRARQTSIASRPDSSQGRTGPESIAGHQNSFGNFTQSLMIQPLQQQQQQQQMQNSLRMRSSTQPSTGPPLAPMYGGPLPKKSNAGIDVAEYNTRLTPLPPSHILTPGATHSILEDLWKPLTKEEEIDLLAVMKKDSNYTRVINTDTAKNNDMLYQRIQQVRPVGLLHWWERGADEDQSQLGKDGPFENFKVLLPADKRMMRTPPGNRNALFSNMSTKQITSERLNAAKYEEDLVPVRLEIEHEGWTLRDTFTWPAPESYKNEMIDRFAITLCEDFGLPPAHFVTAIRESILNQVSDHTAAEAIRPVRSKRSRDDMVGKGRLSDAELKWWKNWRKQLEYHEESKIVEINDDEIESNLVKGNSIEAEIRIQIKLDVTVGAMNLVDQFEWDISDEGSAAENFATIFAADLGLSGEFKTAIAHSIREQVDVYIRSLALVGYSFDGKEIVDDELREPLLSRVASITRSQQDIEMYTPKLMQLSELEILHAERERDKESRRKRRQTRGRRGVNLPDREPLKTARTPAVFGLQQGTNQTHDGITSNTADLFGLSAIGQNRSGVMGSVSGGRGAGISTRRAAAAAANANITSQSIHEYGTPTPVPEASGIKNRGESKRRKIESQSIHFEYPGGLGRSNENENNLGPRFAPSLGVDKLGHQQQKRSIELGNAPIKAPLQIYTTQTPQLYAPANVAAATTTRSSTPVAWNMSKPEEAATQHANYHDGQWYCSNCGVPGSLDGTRRKGPLGDKTLCGICGKFYHRHRKARPVDYTRDFQHHRRELIERGVRSEALLADEKHHSAIDSPLTYNSATVAADEIAPVATVESTAAPLAPVDKPLKMEKDYSLSNTRGNSPDLPFEQVGSPDDSDNSDTSKPSSPVKKSASDATRSASPSKALPISSMSVQAYGSPVTSTPPQQQHQQSSSSSLGQVQQQQQQQQQINPPDWLIQALHNLRMRFPLDRIEVRSRGLTIDPTNPEWRVRCVDCPGKLYTPGPGESLTNFEIHLKNRAHRAAVHKATQIEGRKPYGSQ